MLKMLRNFISDNTLSLQWYTLIYAKIICVMPMTRYWITNAKN